VPSTVLRYSPIRSAARRCLDRFRREPVMAYITRTYRLPTRRQRLRAMHPVLGR